jgi:putative tRNA adenosine deaminase-associated protein
MDDAGVDFVVALWRDEGEWAAISLPLESGDSLHELENALRRLPAPTGAVGFVSVADDFLVITRAVGDKSRLLLTDVSAAHDWPIAREVLDRLGIPAPEDVDEFAPAGDLTLLADFGVHVDDLAAILDDIDMYPDEVVGTIADRIGVGRAVEEILAALPSGS